MRPDPRTSCRRGIAMMMVLVAIAMATILATAYLASRDNSAPIGNNVERATQSRWAALSALQIGRAILETKKPWRTSHTAGKLLDNYPVAGAMVTLEARDLETLGPPTAGTRYVELTATATVNGVTQVAVARAYVPFVTSGIVSVDHNELAIFAQDDILLSANATVTRWPLATQSALGLRINLGTQSQSSGSVQINDSAVIVDGTLFYEAGASGTLLINSSPLAIEQVAMADEIPAPDAPDTGVADPPTTSSDLDVDGSTSTISSNRRYWDGDVDNGTLNLNGNITVVIENDLMIVNNSTVRINGNVKLVVFDDLTMSNNGAIELMGNSTLKLFFGDRIVLTNSYIGEDRIGNERDNSGYAPLIDVNRILVFDIDNTSGTDRHFRLTQNSVVKGVVYAPTMDFEVHDNSALYGRATGMDVTLDGSGALFYDHALDPRNGYTNLGSDLFVSVNGDIVSQFESLSSLNATPLTNAADALDLHAIAFGQTYGTTPPPPPDPPLPPDQPTPRTVTVEFTITSFGTDMFQAEEDTAGM